MSQYPELIDIVKSHDERGFFEQSFPYEAMRRIPSKEKYVAASMTREAFTVRGMHFQAGSLNEAKLVRVIQGSLLDVVISTDASLSSAERIFTFELSENVPQALFVPRGFAHGFQTLSDNTLVLYCLDRKYSRRMTRGYNPLSPEIARIWRGSPVNIKAEDLRWPEL